MKVIKNSQMSYNTFMYFGYMLEIPEGTTHVATNEDGKVFAYRHEPIIEGSMWGASSEYEPSKHIFVNTQWRVYCARFELDGKPFSETLVEVGD